MASSCGDTDSGIDVGSPTRKGSYLEATVASFKVKTSSPNRALGARFKRSDEVVYNESGPWIVQKVENKRNGPIDADYEYTLFRVNSRNEPIQVLVWEGEISEIPKPIFRISEKVKLNDNKTYEVVNNEYRTSSRGRLEWVYQLRCPKTGVFLDRLVSQTQMTAETFNILRLQTFFNRIIKKT